MVRRRSHCRRASMCLERPIDPRTARGEVVRALQARLQFGHSSHHTPCDDRLDLPACPRHIHLYRFALHDDPLPRRAKCNRAVLGQGVLAIRRDDPNSVLTSSKRDRGRLEDGISAPPGRVRYGARRAKLQASLSGSSSPPVPGLPRLFMQRFARASPAAGRISVLSRGCLADPTPDIADPGYRTTGTSPMVAPLHCGFLWMNAVPPEQARWSGVWPPSGRVCVECRQMLAAAAPPSRALRQRLAGFPTAESPATL